MTECFCLACDPKNGEIGRDCVKPAPCNTAPERLKTAEEWDRIYCEDIVFCETLDFIRSIQSNAIASSAAGVPEGWQLVPIKPTEEMLNADFQEITDLDEYVVGIIYKAMLAAVPKLPEQKV